MELDGVIEKGSYCGSSELKGIRGESAG